MGRKSNNDIAFRAGDVRSTYDEELLEKASDAGLRVERARKKLYEKLLSEGDTRGQLQNAMLRRRSGGWEGSLGFCAHAPSSRVRRIYNNPLYYNPLCPYVISA